MVHFEAPIDKIQNLNLEVSKYWVFEIGYVHQYKNPLNGYLNLEY